MGWNEKAWAAAVRERRARTLRLASLARGGKQAGALDATAARFLSATASVDDFEYVEDDGDDLIVKAQRRLMWGHRLTGRAYPFEEIVVQFEWALDTADAHRGRLLVNKDVARQRALARATQVRKTRVQKAAVRPKRRKKLKNRTRAERIADLKQALGGG